MISGFVCAGPGSGVLSVCGVGVRLHEPRHEGSAQVPTAGVPVQPQLLGSQGEFYRSLMDRQTDGQTDRHTDQQWLYSNIYSRCTSTTPTCQFSRWVLQIIDGQTDWQVYQYNPNFSVLKVSSMSGHWWTYIQTDRCTSTTPTSQFSRWVLQVIDGQTYRLTGVPVQPQLLSSQGEFYRSLMDRHTDWQVYQYNPNFSVLKVSSTGHWWTDIQTDRCTSTTPTSQFSRWVLQVIDGQTYRLTGVPVQPQLLSSQDEFYRSLMDRHTDWQVYQYNPNFSVLKVSSTGHWWTDIQTDRCTSTTPTSQFSRWVLQVIDGQTYRLTGVPVQPQLLSSQGEFYRSLMDRHTDWQVYQYNPNFSVLKVSSTGHWWTDIQTDRCTSTTPTSQFSRWVLQVIDGQTYRLTGVPVQPQLLSSQGEFYRSLMDRHTDWQVYQYNPNFSVLKVSSTGHWWTYIQTDRCTSTTPTSQFSRWVLQVIDGQTYRLTGVPVQPQLLSSQGEFYRSLMDIHTDWQVYQYNPNFSVLKVSSTGHWWTYRQTDRCTSTTPTSRFSRWVL